MSLQDMSAVAVVTANEGVRGGKKIPLRKTVSAALSDNKCPSVKNVFVMERTNNVDSLQKEDILLSKAMASMGTGICQELSRLKNTKTNKLPYHSIVRPRVSLTAPNRDHFAPVSLTFFRCNCQS